MFFRTLKMTFWVTYDHLGKFLVANVLAMTILSLPIVAASTLLPGSEATQDALIVVVLLAVASAMAAPVLFAGIAHMTKEFIETHDGSLRTMIHGTVLYAKRAAVLGLFYFSAAACLLASLWFYSVQVGPQRPWIGYSLAGAAFWGLLFLAAMGLVLIPALVQKRGGVLDTLKLSAVLVLGNPLAFFGLAIQIVLLSPLLVLPPILLLISASVLIALTMSFYELLWRRYALGQAKATNAHNLRDDSGLGVSGAIRDGRISDREDDYLNRGIRDLLFPWKE